MRNINSNILSAADNQTTNGNTVDSNQLVSASFQAYFGDTQAAGTFKLQASNDINNDRYQPANFTPTNWVDIPNQTASITSGTSALLTIANMCYRWIRAVYTTTAIGAQLITAIADTGVKQVQTVDTVADVAGSLNSTYFLLSSVNTTSKAQKNFYLWLDNGAGVDPAIPARTAIHVTYTNGDSANTLATSIRSALNALTGDFVATGATNHVIITNVAPGLVTAAADGVAPTGFTFTNTTPGVASNLNNHYFFLNSKGNVTRYYVWFNVDTIGTDPTLAGKTAIPVAITSGATASTIGGLMATAIAAANASADFTATNASGAVTVTNKTAGAFTPASDFNSGFTFAVTGGGSTTVNVLMNGLGI